MAALGFLILPKFELLAQSPETEPKRVLTLYWYGRGFPGNVEFERGLEKAFRSVPEGTVEYYPEYLETDRFPGEAQSLLLRDYLHRKYSDRRIDVVIAESTPALEFLLKYRSELFPDTPIVYKALERPRLSDQSVNLTGVVLSNIYRSTLDLALRLQPATKKALIVCTAAQPNSNAVKGIKEELKEFETRIALTYLSDISTPELLSRVRNASRDSIILYIRHERKELGKHIYPIEGIALVAKAANIPIYGIQSSFLGYGIVGGRLIDAEAIGTQVGEIALRIANKTQPKDVPVVDASLLPMFDWRQLRRWGIRESELPPGSIVRFKQLTFWQHYKWYIVGVLTLCALQALLISVLLIERAHRRRARAALNERLRFETLLSGLSAEFATLPAAGIDQGIQKWVNRLGEFLGVEDSAFLELPEASTNGPSPIEPTFSGGQLLRHIPADQRRKYVEQLRSGVTVNLPRIAEVSGEQPDDASPRLRSLLAIPVAANGTSCALGFATTKSYRDWSEDVVPRLRLAGEIFAGAVVRGKHEEALRASEARYRAFFELTAVGAGQASPEDGRLLRVNDAHCRITGHTREELLALRFSDITHPEDREKDLEQFRRLIRGEIAQYTSEKRYVSKNGAPVWVQVDVSLVRDSQGRPLHTVAIVQDINARKRAQEALARSEEFNRRIIESSADCMKILDLEGRLIYMNPGGQRMMQIEDFSAWQEKSWPDFWQGEDNLAALTALTTAKAGGTGTFQGYCPTALGSPKWWDLVASPMRNTEGTVERLLVISRDITSQKKTDALRAGEKQVIEMIATDAGLEDILTHLAILIESQADGMICSILLLDQDGLHMRHGAAPSLPESYTRAIDGLLIGPQAGSCGTAMYRRERVIVSNIAEDPLWEDYRDAAEAHGLRSCWSTPIFSSHRNVLGSFAVYHRVTCSPSPHEVELVDRGARIAGIAIERRKDENELRDSESKNRALLTALPDMMFLVSGDGVYLDCHTRDPQTLHVPPEQFLGKNMREILPIELAEAFALKFEQAEKSRAVVTLEYSLPIGDDNRFFEARLAQCGKDKYLSIVRDVTDRKRSEESLRQSEERFRQLAENIGSLFFITEGGTETSPGKVLYVSPAYETIWGRSCESLYRETRSWMEAVHPEDRERIKAALPGLSKGKFNQEFRIVRGSKQIRWVQARVFPVLNERGEIYRVAGIVDDITARKQAQEALRESEQRYRNVVETQTELICRNLPDSTLTFVNDAYCRFFNKTREELIGVRFLELIPESVHPAILRHIESLVEDRHLDTSEHEHEVLLPNQTIGWQHWVNRKIVDAQGEVIEIQGIGRDVTQRKRAEMELRESEERYRNVVETQTELICRYECDTTLTFVNDAYCRYFGKTREELIGTKFLELIPEEARPAALAHIESLIADPRAQTDEHQVIRADGTIGWQQWVDYAIRDVDGTVLEMQAIGRDITERKWLEENLQGREREFSTLVENSPDIISRLDRDLRFMYISPVVQRVLGVSPDDFIGKTTREIGAPPHDWEAFEASCHQAFATGEIVDREFSYDGRHYHSRLIPEFGTSGSVESILCISEDYTARRRAERELVQMSVRLLGLQDEERRHLARQLHDVTAQNLFATTINLSRLQSTPISPEHKEVLAECQSLCNQALQEIRTLSYLLHPPMLDEAGLVSALRWYIEGFSRRSGIDVGLVVPQEIGRLSRDLEADLFRIVQESLANVHHHSGSSTADVHLEKQGAQIVLKIRDEGHGMKPREGSTGADATTLGVGILGMRQRLRQLGGHLQIESSPQGTTVIATVPLRDERRRRSRATHAGAS